MQDIFVPSHVSAGFFFPQKESVQVFVKLCYIGRFQKISILYHGWLLEFPKGRGGVPDYGILRAWGVFTI